MDDEEKNKNQDNIEEKEDEMNIPLPDFNTSDHKVKRILDMIPDYNYLFEH